MQDLSVLSHRRLAYHVAKNITDDVLPGLPPVAHPALVLAERRALHNPVQLAAPLWPIAIGAAGREERLVQAEIGVEEFLTVYCALSPLC